MGSCFTTATICPSNSAESSGGSPAAGAFPESTAIRAATRFQCSCRTRCQSSIEYCPRIAYRT
jgi:hypothetical protein